METIKSIRMVMLLVIGVVMASCAGNQLPRESDDSWYRAPSAHVRDLSGWSLMEVSRVHEVIEPMQSRAQTFVSNSPYRLLSNEEAEKLIGGRLPNVEGTHPFLVRGLFLNRNTGGYYVSIENSNIWVHHASLGRATVSMKRQALVLQLKEKPKELYVTCSMAE